MTEKTKKKNRISLYVDDEKLKQLNYISDKFDITNNAVMNMALTHYYESILVFQKFTQEELINHLKKMGAKEVVLSKKK